MEMVKNIEVRTLLILRQLYEPNGLVPLFSPLNVSENGSQIRSTQIFQKYPQATAKYFCQILIIHLPKKPKFSFKSGLEKSELRDTPKRLKIITKSATMIIICIKPLFCMFLEII